MLTETPPAEIAPYVQSSDLLALMQQRQEGLSACEALKALPCATPDQEQFFADGLTRVRLLVAGLEEKRTAITKPLLEAKRQIDALFKPTRDAWSDVETVIRGKIQVAQQTRRDEAARAQAEAIAAAQRASLLLASTPTNPVDVAALREEIGQETRAVAVALSQVPDKFVPAGVSVGAEWEADLVDLGQVPREFLTIDWSKVKLYLKEHAKSEHIPSVAGFNFRRVAKVRAR